MDDHELERWLATGEVLVVGVQLALWGFLRGSYDACRAPDWSMCAYCPWNACAFRDDGVEELTQSELF